MCFCDDQRHHLRLFSVPLHVYSIGDFTLSVCINLLCKFDRYPVAARLAPCCFQKHPPSFLEEHVCLVSSHAYLRTAGIDTVCVETLEVKECVI